MRRWSIAVFFLVLGGVAGAWIGSTALQGQAPQSTNLPRELASYRDVVKQVLPAVVSVVGKPKLVTKNERGSQQRRPRFEIPPGVPEEFRPFFREFEGRGLELPDDMPTPESQGSGFIVDPKGIVVTNNHVVAGLDRVEVVTKDGKKFVSIDVKRDPKNDLAIVRIKASSSLPFLRWGDSDAMEIGDRVLAYGAPFGLTGSVTSGIISAQGRSGLAQNNAVYEDYLQTDAAINPGNSGGPLVNLAGEVIGINTAIRSRNGGFQGVGLAIASNVAKPVVDQLIKDGTVHRGYLGVQVGPLKPGVAEGLGLPSDAGVEVSKVFPNSPAAKAGIKALDIITDIGGKKVKTGRELQHIVAGLPLRKPVELAILHDGKSGTVSATIEEQPTNYGLATREETAEEQPAQENDELSLEKIGLNIADATHDVAGRFGYKADTQGVIVTRVHRDSIAAEAGLVNGMLVHSINRKPVDSAEKAKKAIEKASLEKGILLQVEYPPALPGAGGSMTYVILKAETADK
jgi:serine protease Do